jgi:hypothetical protein
MICQPLNEFVPIDSIALFILTVFRRRASHSSALRVLSD